MLMRRQMSASIATSQSLSISVCSRCLAQLTRPSFTRARNASTARGLGPPKLSKPRVPQRGYFAANGIRDRFGHNIYGPLWSQFFTNQSVAPPSQSSTQTAQQLWSLPTTDSPHEPPPVLTRARRRKKEQEAQNDQTSTASLPPDAASTLSTLSSTQSPQSLRHHLTSLLALSKPRLTFLMVLTTAASYTLYPTPSLLLSAPTPTLSSLTLLYLTLGTTLCSASANSLNMLLEPAHDAKMSRTRNRPLVRGLVSTRAALAFAALTAALGTAGLYAGVNPTVAFLGGANIVLYAGIYTPLKRISALNTWVGAIVGGIPPLMGWAAAAGQAATSAGSWHELLLGAQNGGGWLLASLLFAWQFPHFNALSYTIRHEYRSAGYRMLCWTNPARNGRVALRYAVLMLPICWGLSVAGVTDWGFVASSTVVNAWVVREAVRFWRWEGGKGSARGLFWAGVWQLPILMGLAVVHKKGLWEGLWERIFGEEQEELIDLEEEVMAEEKNGKIAG